MATETTIARPAPYIEALGEQYGKDLTALTATKMPTAGYAPTVAGHKVKGLGLTNLTLLKPEHTQDLEQVLE